MSLDSVCGVEEYVRRYYGECADEYIDYRKNRKGYEYHVQHFVESVISEVDSYRHSFLDLGCGNHSYVTCFDSYIGVEISSNLLENHNLSEAENVNFINDDISNVNYATLDYDFVMSILSLHYIENLKELIDNIRARGVRFIIVIPNPKYDVSNGVIENSEVRVDVNNHHFRYYYRRLNCYLSYLESNISFISYIGKKGKCDNHMYCCVSGVWL